MPVVKNEVVVFFEAKTYEKTKRFAAAADYQLSRAGRVMMAEPIPKRGQKSTPGASECPGKARPAEIWTSKVANDWRTDFSVLFFVKALIALQSALVLYFAPGRARTCNPVIRSQKVDSEQAGEDRR